MICADKVKLRWNPEKSWWEVSVGNKSEKFMKLAGALAFIDCHAWDGHYARKSLTSL